MSAGGAAAGSRALSARRQQVLQLVRQGLPNKAIAGALGVSEQAAKQHVAALMRRFGAPNRAVLAEIATVQSIVGETTGAPEWLRYLFVEAPVMIAVFRGPTHVCAAANRLYRRFVGDRPLVGRTLRAAFPEPATARLLARADRVYASGEASVWRAAPIALADGRGDTVTYVDSVLHPSRDASGTVDGLVCFATDVSELVSRQREVDALLTQRAALADATDDGIVLIGEDGRRLLVNGTAQRMGFGADEVRPPAERLAAYRLRDPATGAPLVRGPSARVLAGETIESESILLRLPGRERDLMVKIWGAPLRDNRGRIAGALLRFRELTAP